MIYPWAYSQWQQLVQRQTEGRLPHAMLFNGIEGLGKRQVAHKFAMALLCERPDEQFMPCGNCRSCTQFRANSHPDFHLIEPSEAGKAIKIDQIRSLIDRFSLAGHYGRYRVAIIDQADSMTLAAANSLLKSLEEPPERTLLILVTSSCSTLPATILSRCQKVHFDAPGLDMATSWLNKQHNELTGREQELLAMASHAPLLAVEIAESGQTELRDEIFGVFLSIADGSTMPLGNTGQWLKAGISAPIQWVYSWVCDLIKLKNQFGQAIVNHDKSSDLQMLAQQVELTSLYQYLDKILDTLKKQHAPLNTQMIMDDLLLDWKSITAAPRSQ
jgi:DNA polymerase-3 subunit delta'